MYQITIYFSDGSLQNCLADSKEDAIMQTANIMNFNSQSQIDRFIDEIQSVKIWGTNY